MKRIDLRSDTATLPTPAMREAMYRAELGDDVLSEDPTTNRLEELAAERLGKEAGLFVSSGTQGNLLSILSHTQRGDEVVVGDKSHILGSEVAGAACLGGVQLRSVPNDGRGRLEPAAVRATIRGENIHFPRTALICLENTHNRCNGAALSAEEMHPIAEIAREHGIPLHVDGARIFNAAVALGVRPADLVREVDSVQFCLSKGLSAPIGSLIVGRRDFIDRARKYRKMVGGGMRQVGVIAAAGIVALEEMVDRLAEDHANAQLLVRGMAAIPALEVEPDVVETNIIFYHVKGMPMADFAERLKQRGVLVGAGRIVTHWGVEREDIEYTLEQMRAVTGAREASVA